jgi:hypothetical protein
MQCGGFQMRGTMAVDPVPMPRDRSQVGVMVNRVMDMARYGTEGRKRRHERQQCDKG